MTAQIKFYLDEHVNPAVAKGLQLRGIDVLTVAEAGMLGATDTEHLKLATTQARVLFTQDADFLRLHAAVVTHMRVSFTPDSMKM